MIRVLLDENFPAGAARSLEAAGHEVAMVATLSPGLDDRGVLALARAEARVLLTFDSDFGELVFQRSEPPPPAIVLVRLHPIVVAEVLALALRALRLPTMEGFMVVTRTGLRRRSFGMAGSATGD